MYLYQLKELNDNCGEREGEGEEGRRGGEEGRMRGGGEETGEGRGEGGGGEERGEVAEKYEERIKKSWN